LSTFLVTGGGGFVGAALCRALQRQGHSVVAVARGSYPELEATGIRFVKCDISNDIKGLTAACAGVSGVFHVASKVDSWGDRADFFSTNVVGTQNVISACRAAKVKHLVYTSTPSVVECGRNLINGDETLPYPNKFDAYYPETKAIAEKLVLESASNELRTVSLRPHLIWGPGDTHLVPMIIERARIGRLVKIGAGENLVDVTFIDDCVSAHILAMEALMSGRANVSGRAFFISQGEPVKLWDWVNSLLEMHGMQPITRSVNYTVAHAAATLMELAAKVSGGRYKPLFTRFLIRQMAKSHYFSIGAARNAFGYSPQYSISKAYDTYRQAMAA
jgi:nucleoside-diphosphate-sugar epimerase